MFQHEFRATAAGDDRHDKVCLEIDQQLRDLARRRGELDATEVVLLNAAEAAEIHCRFDCMTMLEYLEDVVGYAPRTATERLRVAKHNRAHVGRVSESDAALAMTEPVSATAVDVPPGTVEIHRRGESHVQTRHANRRSGRTATVGADVITTVSSVIRTQATAALVGLGWKPAVAGAAIDGACAALAAPTLEALIREGLRRCPIPLARAL